MAENTLLIAPNTTTIVKKYVYRSRLFNSVLTGTELCRLRWEHGETLVSRGDRRWTYLLSVGALMF